MKYVEEKEEEKNPEIASLQDLMAAMGALQSQRLPKKADPMSVVREGEMGGAAADPLSVVREGEMPGMDPRLAEIIKKKRAGL